MKIPPFWQRATHRGLDRNGRQCAVTALGWSLSSSQEARRAAERNAERLFGIVVLQGRRPDRYEYNDRTIREPILARWGTGGEEWALVTRNRYGAEVLNTTILFIADIDFPPRKFSLWSTLRGWLRREWGSDRDHHIESQIMATVQAALAQRHLSDYRLYRTPGGLRLILTDRRYQPKAPETLELLDFLEADPLYQRLVRQQACFRARLTPKPWRIRCSGPPVSYPWVDAVAEQRFTTWLSRYQTASRGFRACALRVAMGEVRDPELAELVAWHDRRACGQEGETLA